MKYGLQVALPCSEQWNLMNKDESGRHCALCNETVIDFTGMAVDEIVLFLQTHSQKKICGRVAAEQVDQRPVTPDRYLHGLLQSALPYLKKISAVILFVFCLTTDGYAQQTGNKLIVRSPRKPDQMIMGKIAVIKNDPVKTPVKAPGQVPDGNTLIIKSPNKPDQVIDKNATIKNNPDKTPEQAPLKK